MSSITDSMKLVFLDSYRLMELEKQYNYLNYGKYPYRERKNSIQIKADFNAMAYDVSGLFVDESEYTNVYPQQVIETVELIVTGIYQVFTSYTDLNGDVSAPELALYQETFQPVITREYVDIEDVTVQTVRYLFPFDCAIALDGSLNLSF